MPSEIMPANEWVIWWKRDSICRRIASGTAARAWWRSIRPLSPEAWCMLNDAVVSHSRAQPGSMSAAPRLAWSMMSNERVKQATASSSLSALWW